MDSQWTFCHKEGTHSQLAHSFPKVHAFSRMSNDMSDILSVLSFTDTDNRYFKKCRYIGLKGNRKVIGRFSGYTTLSKKKPISDLSFLFPFNRYISKPICHPCTVTSWIQAQIYFFGMTAVGNSRPVLARHISGHLRSVLWLLEGRGLLIDGSGIRYKMYRWVEYRRPISENQHSKSALPFPDMTDPELKCNVLI